MRRYRLQQRLPGWRVPCATAHLDDAHPFGELHPGAPLPKRVVSVRLARSLARNDGGAQHGQHGAAGRLRWSVSALCTRDGTVGGSVVSGGQRPLKLLASGVFCRGARRARPAPQHLSRYTDDRFDRLLRLRPDPAPSTEVSRTRRPRRPVRLVLFNIAVISCCSAAAARARKAHHALAAWACRSRARALRQASLGGSWTTGKRRR